MVVLRALFISLFVHTALLYGLWLFAPSHPPLRDVVELDLEEASELPPPPKEHRNFVKETLVPDEIKAPDDETLAKLLSRQRQRVKKEIRALADGRTENRDLHSNSEDKIAKRAANPHGEQNDDTAPDGYRRLDLEHTPDTTPLQSGISTLGEVVSSDIGKGALTALNTDRHLFYSFYSRVDDLMRYRWQSRLNRAAQAFSLAERMRASEKEWVTVAEFILTKTGELHKTILLKSSGIEAFDRAAIQAFQDARVFPNPPKDMVEEDGFIHLRYALTVQPSAPNLARRNSRSDP